MNHPFSALLFTLLLATASSGVTEEKSAESIAEPCEEEVRFLLAALQNPHPGEQGAMLALLSMKEDLLAASEHATCRAVAREVRKHY